MFQLFKSTVYKWTFFKSDCTSYINFRPCVSFLWFPLLILGKENGIWLEWKCVLQPILIFHLQVTACNVLLLWSHNENVSVYSHFKEKQPQPPGARGLCLVNLKWECYTPSARQGVCCRFLSLLQLNSEFKNRRQTKILILREGCQKQRRKEHENTSE